MGVFKQSSRAAAGRRWKALRFDLNRRGGVVFGRRGGKQRLRRADPLFQGVSQYETFTRNVSFARRPNRSPRSLRNDPVPSTGDVPSLP